MSVRGGRASRQKGDRFERQIVRILQDHAFGAERVPLSGSAGGSYTGDFTVPLLGRDLTRRGEGQGQGVRDALRLAGGPRRAGGQG